MTTWPVATSEGTEMTARSLLVFVAAVALATLAGPALAAYPPAPGVVVEADVVVGTPCVTIKIEGDNMGEGIFQIIEVSPKPAECTTAETSSSSSSSAGGTRTAGTTGPEEVLGEGRVRADGTFSTEIQVAEEFDGDLELLIRGTGSDGQPQEVATTVALRPLRATVDDAAGGLTNGHVVLGGLLAAGMVSAGLVLRRRRAD